MNANLATRTSLLGPALQLTAGIAVAIGLWFLSAAGPASAQSSSCQSDFANLNKRLEAQIASINALTKGKKKQLDPAAACPRLRNLAATERQLLAYMKKEQSWCGIPDALIVQINQRVAKTSQVAGQACKAASQQAQMRRQAQQQATQAVPDSRPKLPAGPL